MIHHVLLITGLAIALPALPVAGQLLPSRPRAVVKLAPLSILDIDPTVQGAIELPVHGQTTVQIEGGYGWAGLDRSSPRDGGITNKQTGRLRAEARYYLPRTTPIPDTPYPTGLYAAGEILVKRLSANRPQSVVYPCLVAPCPVDTDVATIKRTVLGGHLKLGYQTGLGLSRTHGGFSRFVVDTYIGIGARHIRVRQVSGLPVITANGNTPEGVRFTRFVPGRSLLAGSLSGGIKLGFAL